MAKASLTEQLQTGGQNGKKVDTEEIVRMETSTMIVLLLGKCWITMMFWIKPF